MEYGSRWITSRGAAQILNVSRCSVTALARKGYLTPREEPCGGAITRHYFRRKEVEALAARPDTLRWQRLRQRQERERQFAALRTATDQPLLSTAQAAEML